MAAAERLIQHAISLGINLVDTAPGYGTEALLGRALKSIREPVYIATKIPCFPASAPEPPEGHPSVTDPRHVIDSVETSLGDLQREVLDIVQLHGARPCNMDSLLESLVPAMLRLREQGKIRFLGLTENPSTDHSQDAAARACECGVFDTLMVQYGIFDQEADRRTFPLVRQHDIGVFGMCAARAACTDSHTLDQVLRDLGPPAPRSLDFLLQGPVTTHADAAFRFAAAREEISCLLVGTGSPAHLVESTAAILGAPLPAEHMRILGDRLGRLDGSALWTSVD